MTEKSWEEMNESERYWACQCELSPRCPYCGYEHNKGTYFDFPPDDEGTHKCDNCGEEFNWESNIPSVKYSTSKIEEESQK